MSSPPPVSLRVDVIDIIISAGAPVSIDVLRNALKIAKNCTEVLAFHNPELPSACIRMIQERSKSYPRILDDEFSVMCLGIIAICVQVATLVTCNTMDAFVEEVLVQRSTLLEFTSSSLQVRFRAATNGSELVLNPFITMPEAITLMEYLHRERHHFLRNRCASPKVWDGWSFILLPAWFYFISRRISDQAGTAQILGDLAYRFAAGEFSYVHEESIVQYFAQTTHTRFVNVTGTSDGYYLDYTDLQDYELMITTVSTKFSTGLPALDLAYYMHIWAGCCAYASRLDLMLELAKASFTRLWHALDPEKEDFTSTYEQLRGVTEFSWAMLGYIIAAIFKNPFMPQAAKGPFIDAALEHNILGLLAQTLMLPLHCNYSGMEQSNQVSLHSTFDMHLESIEGFADFLSMFRPSNVAVLHDSRAEWLRATQHFGEQCHMYNGGRYVQTYISRCQTVWKKLGFSLFGKQMNEFSVTCSYPRCPYPTSLGGAPFACGGCRAVAYCSHRCQYSHWTCGSLESPHIDMCLSSALEIVKR
ncbi:hypothetical protein FRC08_005180 [Ceratobasidium sp. 394]|nr:hypothetical protein FRC08_005180 [Ceratobasidium sp. 394]